MSDFEQTKQATAEAQPAVPEPNQAGDTPAVPTEQTKKTDGGPGEVFEWLESCIFAIVVILLIFTFFFRSATVAGYSMVPTLVDGERLILRQIGYDDPQYGDIIVVDRTQHQEPPIIKRVIGKAGDEIDIDFLTGEVFRNGQLLDEPYINEPTVTSHDVVFPVVVPDGTLFVMGDNRNNSADSRIADIGMIDLRRVMGKAIFRFLPLRKIGLLD